MLKPTKSVPLRLAGIGCGARTRAYLSLAAAMPDKYAVVGAADPIQERVDRVRRECGNRPGFRSFRDDTELLAAGKFADVVVIGTQDNYHVEPCVAAMEAGYDVLLEKPVATNLQDLFRLEKRARALGRKVLVCHVLRYTPFYRKVKGIVNSGRLGSVMTINATEGVGAWHHAHSYVRGHWGVVRKASPMILAKSCHDLDIISWLMDSPCEMISSFGGLSYFRRENAPCDAPPRCADGCPVGDSCIYNALRYITDKSNWLGFVFDHADNAKPSEIREWLSRSPWGRCVYQCENTAVDHQVASMVFQNQATATFSMTAFEHGRHIEIFGTAGRLRAGAAVKRLSGHDIEVRDHESEAAEFIDLTGPHGDYAGHGDGDAALISALYDEMSHTSSDDMATSLKASLESHVLAFAAEEARRTGATVSMDSFVSDAAVE